MNDHLDELTDERITLLERRIRKSQAISVVVVLLLAAALFVTIISHARADAPTPNSSQAKDATFHTVTASRINVVAPDGTPRMVISNAKEFPRPILNGKVLKRRVSPAGLVFYDKEGNERGGLIMAPRHGGQQTALVFDWDCGDGMAMIRSQHKQYKLEQFVMLDPPPSGKPGHGGHARLGEKLLNGTSEIILRNANGTPRIRIKVPKKGPGSIAFLSKDGKVSKVITGGSVSASH
jgi:hypothetical protein